MENEILKDTLLLFEESVTLTGITGYGFNWEDFASGKSIPVQGARFDIAFEGRLTGDQINGTVSGVDFLEVRPDGKLLLNLQARIVTSDGHEIKMTETGITNGGDLRLNMSFHTCSERYAWLNHLQVWGVGKVDFGKGKVDVKGYLI